jgi:putative phosphoesterase
VRTAVIYDVHGNLPALEAVLEEIYRDGAEHLVVGGDVLPGPMPRETLDRLHGLDMPVTFIRGNGDRVVLECLQGSEITEVPQQFRDVIRWTAQQLHGEHQEAVLRWPATCRASVPELGNVLFCHATPRNDFEIFTRKTPEERLAPMFEHVQADVVICGHTHMQFDRTVNGVRIVNAGSVGQPFCQPAGAYWLLLGPAVEFRRTSYDFDSAAERIRSTGYPQAEALAVRYVLDPPSEAETLELFSPADRSG